MKAGLESANAAKVQGKKIEEQCTVSFCGQGNHFTACFGHRLIEDPLEVGRLAAETGSIVNDFAVDFPGGEVNETHAVSSSIPVKNILCRSCPVSPTPVADPMFRPAGNPTLNVYNTVIPC